MIRKEYAFRYPKLTLDAKNGKTGDKLVFIDCDFSNVEDIKFSNFKTVTFNGFSTFFKPNTKIHITNCETVEFEEVSFDNSNIEIHINNANLITFSHTQDTRGMKLNTQKCGQIKYNYSSLNFDTSGIQTTEFELFDTQVTSVPQLNLNGISDKLEIGKLGIWDLQELLVRKGLKIVNTGSHYGEVDIQKVIKYSNGR